MDTSADPKLLRELREQVNTLLSANQLLSGLVWEKGSTRDRDCLAISNQSLYRLMRTVQHLETLQADSAELFHPQPADAADLCRRVGEKLEPWAAQLGVSFTWRLERESFPTKADPHLLERALLNLLANAFQAAGQGGKVTLRLTKKAELLLFTIEDNGPGMAPPDCGEADPFLKTASGLGLGLEVAQRAAALHSGRLMWHARNGGGTVMILSIPAEKPDQSELVKASGIAFDRTGGFSPVLVELSPLLPSEVFLPDAFE